MLLCQLVAWAMMMAAANVRAEEAEVLEPAGCMDQDADNFDEVATVDDGTCLYQGSPRPAALPCTTHGPGSVPGAPPSLCTTHGPGSVPGALISARISAQGCRGCRGAGRKKRSGTTRRKRTARLGAGGL